MKKIKINGKEYDLESATDVAKAQFYQIQAIDSEINRMQLLTASLQTARTSYLRVLEQELEQPGSVKTTE